MIDFLNILIIFACSMIATWWVFKNVLKIAILKNIVDNPDVRKLQRQPVPVLGGVAVFFGIVCALLCARLFFDCGILFDVLAAMIIILYIGTMDDILSLSPKMRLIIEIAIALIFIFSNDCSVNDFHGLWGIHLIPNYISIPLTVFAVVGIINAINLVDGVNGLSSGLCIVASFIYGAMFFRTGAMPMAALMFASMGALVPFYFHNVFGKKSKMFIGDGGTLLMGLIFSVAVVSILREDSPVALSVNENFGLIAFALATLAIPVFDTVRVMLMRMIRHTSPFHPDKTHLHHLLLDFGFSHIGVTITEISMNLLILLIWWISYRLGASVDVQLYMVILFSFLFTFGFYGFARHLERKQNKCYHVLCKIGKASHFGQTPGYKGIRKFLDKSVNFN